MFWQASRNEVINHCGIVRMSPFKLICLYRRCCAELIAQLIMGHGASRALAATLAAHAQQLLLLTGDGGGGHLDHSRVLSYDFHVICETKPQKLNFWGSSLLVATILRFGNFPLTL